MSHIIKPEAGSFRLFRAGLFLSSSLMIFIFAPTLFGYEVIPAYFPQFVEGLFTGLGIGFFAYSLFRNKPGSIGLNEEKLSVWNTSWDKSVRWDQLREVRLYRNRIEFTFAKSGITDSIRIPMLVRSKADEIKSALSELTAKNGIEFHYEVELAVQQIR
ncbi:MAG: hypothetical protein JJU46_04460 [Balneolaceae bacterium]|nr:hypothetical protein [Balneolaceae bacterium]MCH8549317.1 hypothetical protein [Balneolaceae bacterium]